LKTDPITQIHKPWRGAPPPRSSAGLPMDTKVPCPLVFELAQPHTRRPSTGPHIHIVPQVRAKTRQGTSMPFFRPSRSRTAFTASRSGPLLRGGGPRVPMSRGAPRRRARFPCAKQPPPQTNVCPMPCGDIRTCRCAVLPPTRAAVYSSLKRKVPGACLQVVCK